MFKATLVKGATYHCYGLLFRVNVPQLVDETTAGELTTMENFLVEKVEEVPAEPDGDKIPEGDKAPVQYTKAQLTEAKAAGQIEILKSLGLDETQYKNEGERIDAILAAVSTK